MDGERQEKGSCNDGAVGLGVYVGLSGLITYTSMTLLHILTREGRARGKGGPGVREGQGEGRARGKGGPGEREGQG